MQAGESTHTQRTSTHTNKHTHAHTNTRTHKHAHTLTNTHTFTAGIVGGGGRSRDHGQRMCLEAESGSLLWINLIIGCQGYEDTVC